MAFLFWLSAGAADAPSSVLTADELMKGIEGVYSGANTFSAGFKQFYLARNFGEIKSGGKVYFKRPGMMKWIYSTPTKKIISAYRNNLWIFDKQDSQVLLDKNFTEDKVPSTLSFLWQARKLKNIFNCKILKVEDKKGNLFYTVELVPKEEIPNVSKLQFLVDGKNYNIIGTTLFDFFGNENRIYFEDVTLTGNIADSFFVFEPPKGVAVVEPPTLKK